MASSAFMNGHSTSILQQRIVSAESNLVSAERWFFLQKIGSWRSHNFLQNSFCSAESISRIKVATSIIKTMQQLLKETHKKVQH